MSLRLYVVPASHPCAAVEAALKIKGFDYKVTELPPGVHAAHQRLRFGKRTVPSLKADGEKISGSRAIMRWLEEQRPDPPLWPEGPEVERAEAWGEEVLQPVARRVVWWSLRKRPDAMPSYLAKSKLPVPGWAARLSGPVTAAVEFRLNSVTSDAVQADVAASRRTWRASRVGSTRGSWVGMPRTPPISRSARRSPCCARSATCGRWSTAPRRARSPRAGSPTTPARSRLAR